MRHSLTDINIGLMTATCAVCGIVRIRYQGKTRVRCVNKLNELKRIYRFRKEHGIDIRLTKPDDTREICGGMVRIAYDHDHQTGEFRGWLCMKCNTALGLVGDDITILNKMINYLKRK